MLWSPLAVSSATLKGEAQVIPWSGYWWPLQQGELVKGYNGHPSPIEKYDLYTLGHYPAKATYTARTQWYKPDLPYWHGFCNGWANAAILEAISIVPSVANGVYLAVGDKKGLLAAYHYMDLTISEKCRSSPAPFHRYLLRYLGEQGQAVAANLDNSGEFWSYPIYKYEMSIAQGTTYDQVQCTITYADDQNLSPDYEGTVAVEKSYQYRLFKDTDGNYIGGNSPESGEWIGSSVVDHPVLVWVPIGLNPKENFINYEDILAMALSVDDELEGKELVPGHHILVIYPGEKDSFTFRPQIGEHISLQFAFDRQSSFAEGAHLILRRNGAIVSDDIINFSRQLLEIGSETGQDYYQLSFVPAVDNSSTVVIQLYADYSTANEYWSYGFPSSSFWLGFASLADSPSQMFLQVVGEQGLPADSGFKSDSLTDQRWLGMVGTRSTEDYFTDNQPKAVKITSTVPAVSLVFSGNGQCLWGTSQCLPARSQKVVVPWLTHGFNNKVRADLFLHNLNPADLNLTIDYYSSDGKKSHKEVVLDSKKIHSYGGMVDYPGGVRLEGWALLESDKEGLDGSVLLTEGSRVKDQLPLLVPGKQWLAPHLAVNGGWKTTVSLYNPGSQDAAVSVNFYYGQPEATVYSISLPAFSRIELEIEGSLWGIDNKLVDGGWLQIKSNQNIAGYYNYRYGDSAASVPLIEVPETEIRSLPHVVNSCDWWTGLAFVNVSRELKTISLVALADDGKELERKDIAIDRWGKNAGLASNYFTLQTQEKIVAIRLEHGVGVAALGIYGTLSGASQITGFNW